MGQTPHFQPRFVDYAIANLHVRRKSSHRNTAASGHG
jgi:hypothetical protein